MPRTIAIYLPQFHPIAENNSWWGEGFTEWTNVAKAKPLFRGHQQPKIPADLGFTDLRLAETRNAQADLARQYGIEGFCYYHYWFEGHRLIERPFNEVLASGAPDFPFMLCWANETWSRRWLGEEKEILIKQGYSASDHERHARWLAKAFSDTRYIRVHGRPMFMIYRPFDIPDLEASLEIYRSVIDKELGVNPYLVGVDSHRRGKDLSQHGFDHTLNFRPQLDLIGDQTKERYSPRRHLRNLRLGIRHPELKVMTYSEFVRRMDAVAPKHARYFPSVFVNWDNTARRSVRGAVVIEGSPELFRAQVRKALGVVMEKPTEEQILFVNAWNEWAEGNYLEPDLQNGRAYLEALAAELGASPAKT
ncbi:MAG: glycoside hydrolase family 99-like domain-containing protein [Pseudomonadota bacterium]